LGKLTISPSIAILICIEMTADKDALSVSGEIKASDFIVELVAFRK